MLKTIAVEVRLYATLRNYCPGTGIGEPLRLQLADGATLADLLRSLNVPVTEVKTSFVNNRIQDTACRLRQGDRVAFFPPVAGG
jgi:molybdopterin converting factor small subunit